MGELVPLFQSSESPDMEQFLNSLSPELAARISIPNSQEEFDYTAYMRQRVERYNASEGPEKDEHCPLCHNKGNFLEIVDGTEVLRTCQCAQIELSERILRKSGLADVADRYTFEAYVATDPWQRAAQEIAVAYVADSQGKWLALLGQPGCGKTHLGTAAAVAIMREKGAGMRYMAWRDDAARLKALVTDDVEYQRIINPLKTAQILYVDDLFKGEQGKMPTAADINLAFELLNYRYNNPSLVTIISSEKTIDDLIDIDEAVGSRIYERTKNYCIVIPSDKNKNYRLRGGV